MVPIIKDAPLELMKLVHPETDKEGAIEDIRIRQKHMLEAGLIRAPHLLARASQHAWGEV